MRIRRMASVFLAGVFAAGISLVLPQAAHATIVPDPNWNEIVMLGLQARNNTMCVDSPSGSSKEGLELQLWHCHATDSGGAPQRWQFIRWGTDPDGHPAYLVENTGNHLCLNWELALSPHPPPGNITQTSCFRGTTSLTVWVILDETLQTTRLEAAFWNMSTGTVTDFGHCLIAHDFSDNNGTPLNLGDCTRDADKVWALG